MEKGCILCDLQIQVILYILGLLNVSTYSSGGHQSMSRGGGGARVFLKYITSGRHCVK